jgi:hypothetical protein
MPICQAPFGVVRHLSYNPKDAQAKQSTRYQHLKRQGERNSRLYLKLLQFRKNLSLKKPQNPITVGFAAQLVFNYV